MTKGHSPKKQLFVHLARVAKAMASPNRLELLEALAQGERSVEGLATATGMSVANTSHHLRVLREGGLVLTRKEGVQVIYSLSDDEIPQLLACQRHVAERHQAQVERILREHFTEQNGLTPVTHDELMALVQNGEGVVIDVRPAAEYEAGHIPGAVNLPLESLSKCLTELPRQRKVVAYCRGPYCMLAVEAVKQLRLHGFRARRLQDGFPEWKAEKRPVATGKQH
jgi:rhodanese-related sulfurtransferase/DNA-binding transcriptional ArsR family regulator